MNLIKYLTDLKTEKFYIIKKGNNKFIDYLTSQIQESSYLAVIDCKKIFNLKDLFKEFSIVFKFPDYFGNNWAAFDECINDLDWIDTSSYILVLKNLYILEKEDFFDIFMKILFNTANEWTNGINEDIFSKNLKPFKIIFDISSNNENIIEKIKDKGFNDIKILNIE
jgi:RNAse (barnase) inhibitor barstar